MNNVKGRVAVDFFIQLVPHVNQPPVFSSPVCNSIQTLPTGAPFSFNVQASDPDSGDQVTLNVAGLPAGQLTADHGTRQQRLRLDSSSCRRATTSSPSLRLGIRRGAGAVLDHASRHPQCGDGNLDPGEQCDPGPRSQRRCRTTTASSRSTGRRGGASAADRARVSQVCIPGAGGPGSTATA